VLLFSSEEVLGALPAVSSSVVKSAELLRPPKRDWGCVERQIQMLQEGAAQHRLTLFHQLCETLITPLDPEDLFQLSGMMIYTLDAIAASGESFRHWFPAEPPSPLVDLCTLLTYACNSLDLTLRAFLNKKLNPEQFREFPIIRAKANRIVNIALAELFRTEADTTMLLRERELYKHPHAAVARCCETAAALRSFGLKNG
jgi:hypothetical protein